MTAVVSGNKMAINHRAHITIRILPPCTHSRIAAVSACPLHNPLNFRFTTPSGGDVPPSAPVSPYATIVLRLKTKLHPSINLSTRTFVKKRSTVAINRTHVWKYARGRTKQKKKHESPTFSTGPSS